MSDIQIIPLADITVPDGRRGPSADHVAGIAATIEKNAAEKIGYDGLLQPIAVRFPTAQDGMGSGKYILISGEQRLEAHRLLEREGIAAVLWRPTEITARRVAIEENLIRYELTALDKALHVAEYREIHEAEYGAVSAGRPDNTRNVRVLWSEAVQEKFGIGKDASSRHLRIANSLRPEIRDMLRGTGWDDNQKALLELASVPVEQQKAVVDILLDEDVAASTMRDAIAMASGAEPPAPDDKDEVWFRKSTAILTAEKRLRRRFFAEALDKDFDLLRETAEEHGFTLTLTAGRKG